MGTLFSLDPSQTKLDTSYKETTCKLCGLYKKCPKFGIYGEFKKKILIISDNHLLYERKGKLQYTEAYHTLHNTLYMNNVHIDEDCAMISVTNCVSDKKELSNQEIESCRPYVIATINKMKPSLIILLGASSIASVITNRVAVGEASVTTWRGFTIPDQEYKTWISATYYPEFYDICGVNMASFFFREDIQKALKHLKKEVPDYSFIQNSIKILDKKADILGLLEKCAYHKGLVALDYEATGLKPYRGGHEIVCMSMAYKEKDSYKSEAFLYTSDYYKSYIRFAQSSAKKIVANLTYEKTWTKHLFDFELENVVYDPIIGMHVLDNRKGITPVKFQTYIYLGIADYSSHMSKYLQAPPKIAKLEGSHSFNRIRKADSYLLLKYNAMDSLVELIISEKQMKALGLNEYIS